MQHPSARPRRAAIAVLVLSATATLASAQSVWHVDDDAAPGGDGASWATAFASLDDAFAAVAHGDQVWVAEGVYRPTVEFVPGVPRSVVFDIPDFSYVYGGFAGDELALADRAGLFDTTVLSGDVGVLGDDSDNAFKVLRFASDFNQHADARLDGFTVRGGRGTAEHRGGGLHLTAQAGPNSWGILELANCTLVDNESGRGGAAAVDNFSRLRVTRCRFEDNRALVHGGALFVLAGWLWSVNSVWSGNQADENGGVLWVNSSEASSTRFANDVFHDNRAQRGGVAFLASNPPVVPGRASFHHCTMAFNHALEGGAVYSMPDAKLKFRNSIAWANRAVLDPQIHPPVGNVDVVVVFSDVQGGYVGAGNLALDPLFVDAQARDLRTQAGSPVHDAASTQWIPTDHNDIDGLMQEPLQLDHRDLRRRVDDPNAPDVYVDAPAPDMGAFEWYPGSPGS